MATAIDIGERSLNRITTRLNPRDKATIFSIYPVPIDEYKITLFPSHYEIPAGSVKQPSRLVVGAASWWKDIPETNQLIQVPENSRDVAKAVINDYIIGLFGFSGDSQPGLFFVEEEISTIDAQKKYAKEFQEAEKRQRNFWLALVNFADAIWSQQPNPAVISGLMRLAASELGIEDKPWLLNFTMAAQAKCPACGNLRDTAYPICGTCKIVVDPEKFKKLGLSFAENK